MHKKLSIDELSREKKVELQKYGVKISLQFLGGVGEQEKGVSLTGSANLLKINIPGQKQITGVIDFGMFQGCEKQLDYNEVLPFDLSKIDFVIVTHSHMDHIGKLLHFSKDDFQGTIWTTDISRSLIWTMLSDSIKLQPAPKKTKIDLLKEKIRTFESLLYKFDESGREQLEIEIEDLYNELEILKANQDFLEEKKNYFDQEDLWKLFSKLNYIDFYEKVEVKNNITLSFIKSGHLPGAAQAILKIKAGKNKYITLGFSGDLGKYNNPSIWGPPDISKEKFDMYMIESTYAGKYHPDFLEEESKLIEAINKTIAERGKIIIPVFIQGRAQEVLIYLNKLIKENKIPQIPIFYYSSGIENVNNICEKYFPHLFKDIVDYNFFKKAISGKGRKKKDLFKTSKKAAILLASGGMLNGGTVKLYLDLLSDPKNLFISVGYQAEGTLGKKIFIDKSKSIFLPLFGKINVNAKIHNFRGLSGHSDEKDLLEIIRKMKFSKGAKIIINHGEKSPEQLLFGWAVKGIVGHTREVLFASFNEEFYKNKN